MAPFWILVQCYTVAFTVSVAFGSILRVTEDHLYQRLSVEVTDNVPRHLCQDTLNNLEELLTATSQQLYSKSKKKARFDSISILLPLSWSGTDCLNGRPVINDKISVSHHPDFVIADQHPIFGASGPLALQYGQCGEPGLNIRIPYHSLTGNLTEFTKLSTFREWVHYRYGTFWEVGFDWDPLYPAYYQSGPEEKPSLGCGNLTLRDEQMADASILRNKAICDATTDHYDRDAPTKQNLLCNRQAALEKMLNHPDLQVEDKTNFQTKIRHMESFSLKEESPMEKIQKSEENPGFKAPKFSYILPSRKRHILLLDVSQAMNIDRHWEMARNALFRFITHIPAGDEVAIVSFGANAKINIGPTEVTASNREGLYGRVPFRLLNGQQGCLECGLKMALKLMDSPRPIANGALVVLTATPGHPGALQEVASDIESRALPVYLISLQSKMHKDVVALTKYGASFAINPSSFILQNLADIFMHILNKGREEAQKLEKSYERVFQLDNQRHEVAISNGKRGIAISGNFVVEDDLRSNVWVILTSPYKEDVELFEITSPSGQRKSIPNFENGIVYFRLEGLSEAGIWSYKASLYPAFHKVKNEVTVEVIAQPTAEQTIQVTSWTNVKSKTDASAIDEPVVIYAKVSKGQDVPIMNAQVIAKVQRPDKSEPFEVILKDNGNGYPDITSGDGIYSAYFTGFTTSTGLYQVSIEVNHNEGKASTPSLLNPEENIIAQGSTYIPISLLYSTPTSQFSRYAKAAAFYVTKGLQYFVVNGQTELDDVFPPSRVSDLSVLAFVNNTLYATLRWSAPGGDFDIGTADSYEIRCYTNAEALSDTNFANMGIPVHDSLLPTPGNAGDEQTATVGLPWANEVFYYGLVSLDAAGNRSPVSNLIPVYANEVVKDDANEDDDNVIISDSSYVAFNSAVREAFGSNENLIYILVGGVCGVVLIISLICIAVFCRAKRRKAEEKRKQNARTQIFVNDLEANGNNGILPDLAPEKPQNYSEVWTTHNSGLPSNNSPTNSSLEEYANMYMNNSRSTYPASGYPMTSYNAAPVHEFRATSVQHYQEEAINGNNETPTYQNWTHKPPSDNGTATTSSTECYDDHNSDHSHKNNNNNSVRVAPLRRYSVDDYLSQAAAVASGSLSLSPSFCSASEKRRRQESLV